MPRRREVPKRVIIPDPKYNEALVAKFINTLMFDGKRSTAERILLPSYATTSSAIPWKEITDTGVFPRGSPS